MTHEATAGIPSFATGSQVHSWAILLTKLKPTYFYQALFCAGCVPNMEAAKRSKTHPDPIDSPAAAREHQPREGVSGHTRCSGNRRVAFFPGQERGGQGLVQ